MLTSRKKQALETREKIISTTMKLFGENIYEDVKIRDICEACGVSIGTFYYYFSSKEDVIQDAFFSFDTVLQELLTDISFSSNKEAIIFIINNELEYSISDGIVIPTMIFKYQLTTENHSMIDSERYIYKALKKYIETGISSNEFSAVSDIDDVVEHILRTSRGVIYDWCIHNGSYDLIEAGLNDVKLVMNSLLVDIHINS
ncbi:MAG: TetR/AcrR family transcriptional regulator [Clostridioides sp.]|jgi:AcrR family transcriptional regulator|nr:TetR/AcrR family transcriptional regulator [Clostridioides sp.]